MKKISIIILLITVFLFNSYVHADKIEFVNKEQTVYVGSTTKLDTIYTYDEGESKTFQFESSDKNIAIIEFNSLKALKKGKVTISAVDQNGSIISKTEIIIIEEGEEPEEENDKKDSLSINVDGYDLNFDKNDHEYTLIIGNEKKLDISVTPKTKKYSISGNKNLENGSVITVTISGIRKPYIINIQKKQSFAIYFIIIISTLLFLNIIRIIIKNRKSKQEN